MGIEPNPQGCNGELRGRAHCAAGPFLPLNSPAWSQVSSQTDALALPTAALPAILSPMRKVAYSLYMLPPRPGSGPRAQPYRSSWKMSPAEAAGIGALYPVAGTTEIRELPDTPDELRQAQVRHPSAGHGGVKPPAGRA